MPARTGRSPEHASRISSELITDEHTTVWVDVVDPTPEEIARVGREVRLSSARAGRRRARRTAPENRPVRRLSVHRLLRSDQPSPTDAGAMRSISSSASILWCRFTTAILPVIADTAERWRANVATLGNRGTGFLLYSLLDSLVDGYFPVLDDIAERADRLEETIILRGQPPCRPRFFNCGAIC